MEDELHKLIPNVRQSLGDLPFEFITDAQIWVELKRALAFVEYINESTEQKLINKAITALAIFYTYVNYSSLAETRIGNIPTAQEPKYYVFREIALSYLRMITSLPLNDKLVLDDSILRNEKAFSSGILRSVF